MAYACAAAIAKQRRLNVIPAEMTTIEMTINLEKAVGAVPNNEVIKKIYTSILEFTVVTDWKGSCHESSAVIHILLNEFGIANTWCIGEALVDHGFFDHSWIEIDNSVYDIAVYKALNEKLRNGPVINGIDIITNKRTTTAYGVTSGLAEHQTTRTFKNIPNLGQYLLHSPMHPKLGAWMLIDYILKNTFKKTVDLPALIARYNSRYYTTRP